MRASDIYEITWVGSSGRRYLRRAPGLDEARAQARWLADTVGVPVTLRRNGRLIRIFTPGETVGEPPVLGEPVKPAVPRPAMEPEGLSPESDTRGPKPPRWDSLDQLVNYYREDI